MRQPLRLLQQRSVCHQKLCGHKKVLYQRDMFFFNGVMGGLVLL